MIFYNFSAYFFLYILEFIQDNEIKNPLFIRVSRFIIVISSVKFGKFLRIGYLRGFEG